jgi:hypothetical protein
LNLVQVSLSQQWQFQHPLSKSLPLIFHHILTTGPFFIHFQVEKSTSLLQVDFKCSYNIPATCLHNSFSPWHFMWCPSVLLKSLKRLSNSLISSMFS